MKTITIILVGETRQDELLILRFLKKINLAQMAAAKIALNQFAYCISRILKAPLRAVNQLAHWLEEDYAVAVNDEGRKKIVEGYGGSISRWSPWSRRGEGVRVFIHIVQVVGREKGRNGSRTD